MGSHFNDARTDDFTDTFKTTIDVVWPSLVVRLTRPSVQSPVMVVPGVSSFGFGFLAAVTRVMTVVIQREYHRLEFLVSSRCADGDTTHSEQSVPQKKKR